MRESALEKKAKTLLEAEGYSFIKVKGPIGWPDRQLVGPGLKGRVVFAEMKKPGGKVSPAQASMHSRLRVWGYTVQVCWDLSDVDYLLQSLKYI